MKPKLSTFISYAEEDLNIAKELYDDLKIGGVNPWVDFEALDAGQNWKDAKIKAIRESSHFITLISKNSATTKGFVQKELKIALDIYDERPKGDVYIIPVKIDDYTPGDHLSDERLRNIHCVDLYPNYRTKVDKIIRSILKDLELYVFDPMRIRINKNGEPYLIVKFTNQSPFNLFDVDADLYCIIYTSMGYYHTVPTVRQKIAPVLWGNGDYWIWTFDLSNMLNQKEIDRLGTDFISKFLKLISSDKERDFSSSYFIEDGIDIKMQTIFREKIRFFLRLSYIDELSGRKKFLRYEVNLNDVDINT